MIMSSVNKVLPFITNLYTFYLEKAMATHSSTLAWKIPWTEELGGLQSMGPQRVGHNWATSLSLFPFMRWRRKWQPTPCSCLENPRDGGAWWAAVYGVAQSWTRLKWLSSRIVLGIFKPFKKTVKLLHIKKASLWQSHCKRASQITWLNRSLDPLHFNIFCALIFVGRRVFRQK